jgi:hypothetical protein
VPDRFVCSLLIGTFDTDTEELSGISNRTLSNLTLAVIDAHVFDIIFSVRPAARECLIKV